jgi:3-methyl-2-oxobutanoate hydroxymethyltransferase
VNVLGGYNAGTQRSGSRQDRRRCQALADAGAFAIVIEGVEPIAIQITQAVLCPTIGIGARRSARAGAGDRGYAGHVLNGCRFVKIYENLVETISGAAARYADEVRNRTFPGIEQTAAVLIPE